MTPTTIELALAVECYGYGHWDAKFWFIDLEQGQTKDGTDNLHTRHQVFKELNSQGLCDSAKFHNDPRINLPWHQQPKPPLQATWRSLILILKSYLSEDIGVESRREYQRDYWGRSTGDTCVIEYSGLPANSLSTNRDRTLSVDKRIAFIKGKIEEHPPRFVVMYGDSGKTYWNKIAGHHLQINIPLKIGTTTYLQTKHPTDFFEKGQKKNQYYAMLGTSLREA